MTTSVRDKVGVQRDTYTGFIRVGNAVLEREPGPMASGINPRDNPVSQHSMMVVDRLFKETSVKTRNCSP